MRNLRFLLGQPHSTFKVAQAKRRRERGQASVGVVLPQQQPKLGTRGEHAVWFVDAAGHQIIDQHADVRLLAPDDQRFFAGDGQRRVRPGD